MTTPVDWAKLKETKVTLPVIAVVALVIFGVKFNAITVDYLDDFFLSKAVAEEQYAVITEQVTETSTLVVTHINEYKLNENAKATRETADQVYMLELYIAANGDSDLTTTRKRDLTNALSRLGRQRACIIRNAAHAGEDDPPPPENCDAII